MDNDFLNKPTPGEVNKKAVEEALEIADQIFKFLINNSVIKKEMTVADLNYLIHIHMESLIRNYDLEYSDFKNYISIWENLMREKEKERRELWD